MAKSSDPDIHAAEKALGEDLLRIHVDSYGKGAACATVHILDDSVVCFLDGLELQPSEEFLVASGRGEAVVDVRGRYEDAIETTFSAAVERATGRRVTSFASITKLDPNYGLEVFRLGPRHGEQLQEP